MLKKRQRERLMSRHTSPAEGEVVDICKECHEDLAVESVDQSTVPWNHVSKVLRGEQCNMTTRKPALALASTLRESGPATYLDLEGSFEPRSKEATEWCQDTGEDGERQRVQLDWVHVEKEAANLRRGGGGITMVQLLVELLREHSSHCTPASRI